MHSPRHCYRSPGGRSWPGIAYCAATLDQNTDRIRKSDPELFSSQQIPSIRFFRKMRKQPPVAKAITVYENFWLRANPKERRMINKLLSIHPGYFNNPDFMRKFNRLKQGHI